MKKSKKLSHKIENYISPKQKALSNLVNGKITKVTKDIFIWGQVAYEIITPKQRGKTSMSHYAIITHQNKEYLIREIGKNSKLYSFVKNAKL